MKPGRGHTLGHMFLPAPVLVPATVLATGPAAFSLMLLLLIAIVVPVAAVAFARSGKVWDEIGKGTFAIDLDESEVEDRGEEIRQMVEARAWRQQSRGEDPGDVEAEIERLLGLNPAEPVETCGAKPREPDGSIPVDSAGPEPAEGELREIRQEIRQVVIANNERRERRGDEPLDVEAEVERRTRELT